MKDQIKTISELSNVSLISIPLAKDQNNQVILSQVWDNGIDSGSQQRIEAVTRSRKSGCCSCWGSLLFPWNWFQKFWVFSWLNSNYNFEKLTRIVFSGGKLWSHWQTWSVCWAGLKSFLYPSTYTELALVLLLLQYSHAVKFDLLMVFLSFFELAK